MADDGYDPTAALNAIDSIRAIAAKHASTPEEAEEVTWLAVQKIADPSFEVESPPISKREEQIAKLRNAYWNFEKLPNSREKFNYQTALHSMLRRYGAKP
jgi:hypothetical protein